MGDSVLEALRLQALQSLKQKKSEPPPTTTVEPVAPIVNKNVPSAPIFIGKVAGPVPKQIPRNAKKNKNKKKNKTNKNAGTQRNHQYLQQQNQQWPMPKVQTLPVGQSGLDPSTLFSIFTDKIVTKAGNTGQGPVQPPPMPSSFHLATTAKAPVPKTRGPVHVIDLDTTEDDDEEDEENSDDTMQVETIPELTRPVISSPEPGEINLGSTEEQSKAQARLNLIKASLEEVDRAYFQNEDLISSAVQKQNEFKAKARQYRALVKKGKVIKKELYQKKSELLYQLTRAKQAFSQCDYHHKPSPLIGPLTITPPVLDFDIAAQAASPVDDSSVPSVPMAPMFSPVEAGEKRKAEYEELQRQLNKVQQDLEQSKLSLIKTKTQKAEKKRLRKEKNPLRGLDNLIKSPRIESPAVAKPRNPLVGTEVVSIEGDLYPLSMIVDLWNWIKSLHPPMKPILAESNESKPSASQEYESPLRWFKSSIFFDHFLDFVSKKGLLSSTFANKIDPMVPFCKAEFDFGCTDKNCKFQHLNQVQLSNDALLENLIQRLLELTPRDMFGSKADVLQFIHEKLSEKSLKGVPVVTLITRLLELKKEITEEPVFVKALQSGSQEVDEPVDKKTAKATLKNFITAASTMPGRCFFELTKDHLRGESHGHQRYYRFSDEDESKSELELFLKGVPEIKCDEDRQDALAYLCSYQSEDATIRLLCLDLASSISRCPLASYPNESLSKPMLWLCFYLTNSFHLKCSLTSRLLACLEGSFELVNLILNLAKCAIDAGMTTEVNVLFLAILKSQMSINADDIIPCAQLCTLYFELDLHATIRLWLFYLEYLHTGTYASRWFLGYPYDGCVDYEFMPIGTFTNLSLFEMTKNCLSHLLEDAVDAGNEAVGSWLAYNLVCVNLESNMSLDKAISIAGPKTESDILKSYLSVPEEPRSDISSPLAVLLQARSLSLHGLKKMSSDLIQNWLGNEANRGVDQFSLLLRSIYDPQMLSDLVSRHNGLLFRLGKAILFDNPVCVQMESLDTILHLVIPKNEALEMVKVKQSPRYLVDLELDLERLCHRLLSNPADSFLWKRLFGMLNPGLEQFMPALKEIAGRYVSCTDH